MGKNRKTNIERAKARAAHAFGQLCAFAESLSEIDFPSAVRRRFALSWGLGWSTWVVIVLAIAVRLRDYGFNRSLWLDEALLALNVVNRSWLALLWTKLEHNQSAPVGFLAAVKFVVGVAGTTEPALRFVPLLASVIVLFWLPALAAHYYDKITAFFAAFALFLSSAFLYYSTEFKQYGLDALVSVALLSEFHRQVDITRQCSYLRFALLGVVAVICSHPACLVLAPIAMVLFARDLRAKRWKEGARLAACAAAWLVVFGVLYWINVRPVAVSAPMLDFHANAFAPVRFSIGAFRWYRQAIEAAFMYALQPSLWILGVLLFTVGLVRSWRDHRPIVNLTIVAVVTLGCVSASHIYPVGPRFLMYLYPILILVMAVGAADLIRRGNQRAVLLLMGVMIYPAVSETMRTFALPVGREETRELVRIIEQERGVEDGLVVWGASQPAYLYYRSSCDDDGYCVLDGDIDRRLTADSVLSSLNATGASGVWVIASHMGAGEFGPDNLAVLRGALSSAGKVEREWTNTDAYLWFVRLFLPPADRLSMRQ